MDAYEKVRHYLSLTTFYGVLTRSEVLKWNSADTGDLLVYYGPIVFRGTIFTPLKLPCDNCGNLTVYLVPLPEI